MGCLLEAKVYCFFCKKIMKIFLHCTAQIHECRNWERGRAVSFLGLLKSDFRYSVESVYCLVVSSKKHVANIG